MVVHGLETFEGDHELPENEVQVAGNTYSVYIGRRVSLAHQSQVHGPARIRDYTFVGMQSLVFRTELGDHVVVEPDAKLIGVKVAAGRYVPALTLVTTQEQADALPRITSSYPYRNLNEGVVGVNMQLSKAGQPNRLPGRGSRLETQSPARRTNSQDDCLRIDTKRSPSPFDLPILYRELPYV